RIDVRSYDPRHARTLMQLAQVEINAVAAKRKEKAPSLHELVLAYPGSDIAKTACDEIVAQFKIIGINCVLRRLMPDEIRPADSEWDLLYVDCVMAEPTIDAGRLLGSDGLVGSKLPHLNLALRQLAETTSWNEASIRLQAIHQIVADDVTVIPLWQLVDYLAHRPGLKGILNEPVTPYDDIEKWRLESEVN
ncbi:MAG: hypothetical protein KDB23_22025, partial [Planctomycetales bacterium]|nr:hypothetical protein [Planctomycetales bacterium]